MAVHAPSVWTGAADPSGDQQSQAGGAVSGTEPVLTRRGSGNLQALQKGQRRSRGSVQRRAESREGVLPLERKGRYVSREEKRAGRVTGGQGSRGLERHAGWCCKPWRSLRDLSGPDLGRGF